MTVATVTCGGGGGPCCAAVCEHAAAMIVNANDAKDVALIDGSVSVARTPNNRAVDADGAPA